MGNTLRTFSRTALAGLLCACTLGLHAQREPLKGPYLGVGLGQHYGGVFGFDVAYWAAPWLSGFVAGGWAVADFSYQTGIQFNLPTTKRASPFITAMYGMNAAIHIKDMEKLDQVYTGPTVGAGVILKQRNWYNHWLFSVNLPLRSQQFRDDWDAVKRMPNVVVVQDPWPITLGVGFHLKL